MKHLKIALVAFALIGLGACAQIQSFTGKVSSAYSVLTEATVSREAVVIARNAFNAVEVTATNYLTLRRCNGSNGPICRDPAATKVIIKYVRSGRVARNNLTQFMKDHPGQLGPQGLYDSLKASTKALQDVLATYKSNS